MKNKEQQAFVHSRMEAVESNVEVIAKIEERKVEAKRKIKSATLEGAEIRAKRLKKERDDRWVQAAISIQQTSYAKLTSKHDETKAQLLLLTDFNNEASLQT